MRPPARVRLRVPLALVCLGLVGAAAGGQTTRRSTEPGALPRAGSPAQLPRAYVDTTPPRASGRTITVAADGDLRAALKAAAPGDTLVLAAGAVYVGPFTLPASSGSAAITLTTSAPATSVPAAGSRIDPSYVDQLPALVAPAPGPVLVIPPGANNYRFVGVEIRPAPGAFLTNLVMIGGPPHDAPPPAHIVFDRCYVHGDPRRGARRGIALNGGATAIINSYLSDFKEVGADSQAAAGWDGPGPVALVNNYFEAAGENVLFGGADPTTVGLVPSDIEIRHNQFSKPLAWKAEDPGYAGTAWTVKNLFELKNARRVLVDGNVFEHNWPQAQNGFAILFTVRNQDGRSPWSTVEDVTFSNNIVRRVASGVNLLGRDNLASSGPTRRVTIRNNLFEDVGVVGGNTRLFQLLNATADVVIEHNTALTQTDSFLLADLLPHEGFVFRDNIVTHNAYGAIGSDTAAGSASIDRFFPGSTFRRNVIVGGVETRYPPDNFFPAALGGVGFANWGGRDYHLVTGSPYASAATDDRAVGVDVAALLQAVQGADVARPRRAAGARAIPASTRAASDGAAATGARVVFWVSIVLLIYTYAGYPLLVTAWAWIHPREWHQRQTEPLVSIVVVAHNEGAAVASKVRNLLSLDYPPDRLDIVVASDGSSDDTVAVAEAAGASRVRVVSFSQRRGKAGVLNDLVPHLRSEIVVFADTRQRIDRGAVRALVAPFADPYVGVVSGELMLDAVGVDATTGRGVGWYWRYEKLIRQSESVVDSTIGATGAMYAIRQGLFEPIPQDTILDDVLIPMRIARRGYRVLFESSARVFDRVADTAQGELDRKVRTSAGNFQLFARERWVLVPRHNRLWLQTISHKGLRLLLPVMHAAAMGSSLLLARQSGFYAGAGALQLGFYAMALAGAVLPARHGRLGRLVAVPYLVCLLSWATVAGFGRFLLGLQPATWEPTHMRSSQGRVLHRHRAD